MAIISGDYHWGGIKTLITEETMLIVNREPFVIENLLNMEYISYRPSKDLTKNIIKKDPLIKQIIDNW